MQPAAHRQKVWVDADTGNETDDAYAIARLLAETGIDLIGVSSVHFNNADLVAFETWNQYPTAGIDTVGISQQLNADLLRLAGRSDVPHPIGADRQIGRAWGGTEPRPSPAVTELAASAAKLSSSEWIDLLALGAMTNIASLAVLHPEAIPRVRCYGLAAKYDVATGVWNKGEFNVRGDLNAFDYVLDCAALDFTHMSVDVSRPFEFPWDEVAARLGDGPVHKFLKDRWQETNPQDRVRILWDLALVEAYLLPQHAAIATIMPPPENVQRPIRTYTRIDVAALADDFWRAMATIA